MSNDYAMQCITYWMVCVALAVVRHAVRQIELSSDVRLVTHPSSFRDRVGIVRCILVCKICIHARCA